MKKRLIQIFILKNHFFVNRINQIKEYLLEKYIVEVEIELNIEMVQEVVEEECV